jgi:hypothetical protein
VVCKTVRETPRTELEVPDTEVMRWKRKSRGNGLPN